MSATSTWGKQAEKQHAQAHAQSSTHGESWATTEEVPQWEKDYRARSKKNKEVNKKEKKAKSDGGCVVM